MEVLDTEAANTVAVDTEAVDIEVDNTKDSAPRIPPSEIPPSEIAAPEVVAVSVDHWNRKRPLGTGLALLLSSPSRISSHRAWLQAADRAQPAKTGFSRPLRQAGRD